MSVKQLMEVLSDINLDKKKQISSKYLKSVKKNSYKNKKYNIYHNLVQSGGSYPAEIQYNLSNEVVSTKIQNIKNALLMMKKSPPPIEIGIFTDVQIHPEDFENAKYEMFEFQQRQKNIKETFSESWIKSKFPIYSRIICVIIKLITCCLSCGQNLLWTILYQWMADNLDLMADFFLGLLGSTKAYSHYTQLFNNVPIFGPVFRILFKLFRTIFVDIGGPTSSQIIPTIIRILYNLILTLRPYFNTIYRYYIVVKQLQAGETTVYISFLMSLIYMFFEKNIDKVPGLRLIRIPLLHHNLWLVFNEIIRFYQAGGSICQWCSGVSLVRNKNYGKGKDSQYRQEIASYDHQGQLQLSGEQQPMRNYSSFKQDIPHMNQKNSYQRYLFGINPESMGFNRFRNFFGLTNTSQKPLSLPSNQLPISNNQEVNSVLDSDYIEYVRKLEGQNTMVPPLNGGGKRINCRVKKKTLKTKVKKNKKSLKKSLKKLK